VIFLQYNFNGKNIRIPDDEIESNIKGLGVSKEEAIQIWLDDEGYTENAEQAKLEQLAKDNRITATIHKATSAEKKERKPATRINPAKEELIQNFAEFLPTIVENVEIINKTKLIAFNFNGKKYKLDLIEVREGKK
jgi:hypothetical protein